MSEYFKDTYQGAGAISAAAPAPRSAPAPMFSSSAKRADPLLRRSTMARSIGRPTTMLPGLGVVRRTQVRPPALLSGLRPGRPPLQGLGRIMQDPGDSGPTGGKIPGQRPGSGGGGQGSGGSGGAAPQPTIAVRILRAIGSPMRGITTGQPTPPLIPPRPLQVPPRPTMPPPLPPPPKGGNGNGGGVLTPPTLPYPPPMPLPPFPQPMPPTGPIGGDQPLPNAILVQPGETDDMTMAPPIVVPVAPSSSSSLLPVLLIGGAAVAAYFLFRKKPASASAPTTNPSRRRRRRRARR